MKIKTNDWGRLTDGREVKLFRFECENKMVVSITNYGGNITSILMPGKDGKAEEITAGFDNLQSYLDGHPYFGVITGRVANRIKNGKFIIDGKEYRLSINNTPNHLHGGPGGLHTKLWSYEIKESAGSAALVLRYTSPDMEEGYPGNLSLTVTYTVRDNNEIGIRYEATTDKATHINLTNHTYFNLSSFREKVFNHFISVNSDFILENDDTQIPTGNLIPLKDTNLNLKNERNVGEAIDAFEGIDHCFVLAESRDKSKPAAILSHKATGRRMVVYTTQPAIQVYTGNNLDGTVKGHNGVVYEKQSAICLETQHYPDSANQPSFPSTLLKPGEKYDYQARFVFEVI